MTASEGDGKRHELPVVYGPVTEKNIEQLRKLNTSIFPVNYDDKFYKDVLDSGEYTKLAYYSSDILIGAICCRVETNKAEGTTKLYVMTIGVLQPYRHLGVGTKLFKAVMEKCDETNEESKKGSVNAIEEAYLHVQTNNDDAIKFYQRFGFEKGEKIENYYKRIEPPDCYVLRKTFAKPAS